MAGVRCHRQRKSCYKGPGTGDLQMEERNTGDPPVTRPEWEPLRILGFLGLLY